MARLWAVASSGKAASEEVEAHDSAGRSDPRPIGRLS